LVQQGIRRRKLGGGISSAPPDVVTCYTFVISRNAGSDVI